MENPEHSLRLKPRILSRDCADFCMVILFAFPVQALGLFILPGFIAFLISNSWSFGLGVPVVIYFLFLSFSVWSMTLSGEGIRFSRLLGSPKFLPWSVIQSVEVSSRRELITKGWFWPLFPCREMTASLTAKQHYRISWADGFCYYPPADAEAFEKYVSSYLRKPIS